VVFNVLRLRLPSLGVMALRVAEAALRLRVAALLLLLSVRTWVHLPPLRSPTWLVVFHVLRLRLPSVAAVAFRVAESALRLEEEEEEEEEE
jgi:hypothetical protein